jgi:hypothetical protein
MALNRSPSARQRFRPAASPAPAAGQRDALWSRAFAGALRAPVAALGCGSSRKVSHLRATGQNIPGGHAPSVPPRT